MRNTIGLVFVVLTASLHFAVTITAQSKPARAWIPAKTPDGQPDLQGTWTNPTITPFERPAALAGKEFLTEAEARAFERQAANRREEDGPPRKGDVGNYNQFWFDSGEHVVSTRRTSLVIDPPDGRVPVRKEAEAARDYAAAHQCDSYEFLASGTGALRAACRAVCFPPATTTPIKSSRHPATS